MECVTYLIENIVIKFIQVYIKLLKDIMIQD